MKDLSTSASLRRLSAPPLPHPRAPVEMSIPASANLPAEILEQIFSLCISLLYLSPRPKHSLAFTEVCRMWYWTARTSPLLWSSIDLTDVALTRYCLARARHAPLSIVSGFPSSMKASSSSNAHMKVTLNHIHDTCNALALSSLAGDGGSKSIMLSSIDVTLFPFILLGLFTALAGPTGLGRVDFSLLTKLILRVPPMSMSVPHVAVAGNVQQHLGLPVPIPSVRHLELDGVSVMWNSVSNLKYLSLRGLVGEECPSVDELTGMLARSSGSLEWCRLESIHPTDEAGPLGRAMDESGDEPIHLSSLKTFTISTQPLTVASILRNLSFSHTTQLHLYTSLHPSLHPALGGDLQGILPPNYRLGQEVSALRLARYSASFLRQARPSSSPRNDPDSTVLSISSASPIPLPLTILNSLSSSNGTYYPFYPTGSIYSTVFLTSLDIGVGVLLDIPEQNLRLFLAGARNLEQIRVGYQFDLWVLLRALLPSGQVEEASSSDVVPCPNLRLLSFNKPTDRDRWWKFGEMWTDPVAELVGLRARCGVKLERLEFWRCHGIDEVELRARMSEKIMMDDLDSVVREVVAGEGY